MSKDVTKKQPREKFTIDVNFKPPMSPDEVITSGSVYSYLASTGAEVSGGFINASFYGSERVFATIESGSLNTTYKVSFVAYTNTGSRWEKDIFVNVRDE